MERGIRIAKAAPFLKKKKKIQKLVGTVNGFYSTFICFTQDTEIPQK